MNKLQTFMRNRKGELKGGFMIGLVISLVIAISLISVVYDVINTTNTTGWSDLTGGSGAEAIFELLLLIFVAIIVIGALKKADIL